MVAALTAIAQSAAAEWALFDFTGLQFWRRDTGRLALLAVIGVAVVLLLVRAPFLVVVFGAALAAALLRLL